jgi:hypothetical protein
VNAVEIKQAVSELAEQPFDRQSFPFQFLAAFGNKYTALKRLRTGVSNKSSLGDFLHAKMIHIATCAPGQVHATLASLRANAVSSRRRARFNLATDGERFGRRRRQVWAESGRSTQAGEAHQAERNECPKLSKSASQQFKNQPGRQTTKIRASSSPADV